MNNLFLIRHAESEANVDNKVMLDKSDYAINITEKGKKQAESSSKQFLSYILENYDVKKTKITFVHSSYQRTTQTASYFIDQLSKHFRFDVKTSDFLVEISFGLYAGLNPKTEYKEKYPEHYRLWEISEKDDFSYFFCPKPDGESYWDVCNRIQLEVEKLKRISEKENNIVIVVAHGGINRCFAKVALNENVEWFSSLDNPDNCEVWGLDTINRKLDLSVVKL